MSDWSVRRLRWVHAVPVVLLVSCLTSAYLLSLQLARELDAAQSLQTAEQQAARLFDDAASVTDILGATAPLAEPTALSLPRSFDEARDLSLRLSHLLRTTPSCRFTLVMLFAAIYLLKQTFSIPGSALLNVMAGFIFGPAIGVPLVSFLTASGASGCYWLSRAVGGELVSGCKALRHRIDSLAQLIAHERTHGNLFVYLLILRIFPLTPNWFLNLAAPLVGVPFPHFFFSCLCGLMPYAYVTVTAGDTLHTITRMQQMQAESGGEARSMTMADVMDGWTAAKLALLAVSLLLPTMLQRYLAAGKNNEQRRKETQFKL